MDYTLQEVRQGTGWPSDVRFRLADETLNAQEIAAVLARLADLWRGTPEHTGIRSAAADLSGALRQKSPTFDPEAFWRACRIDPVHHTSSLEWHWPGHRQYERRHNP